MGKKSTPDAPDYTAAAEAQGESSRENLTAQTYANRPTQITPFGTMGYDTGQAIDPATGQPVTTWTQTTQLTPDLQRALEAQTQLQAGRSEIGAGMLDRIQQEFGPLTNFDAYQKMGGQVAGGQFQGGLGGADQYMGRAGDALMSQFTERMQPRFEQDQARFDATLRARGLKPGDEAYDTALADMRQQQGDQFNQAMFEAQKLSAGEAGRLQGMDQASLDAMNRAISAQFGQDLTKSQYSSDIRARQIAEELQKRGWSLNEANALISGQQVAMPTMPGFSSAGRAETTQYSQAAGQQYQAELDAYNAQQAAIGQMMGAITSPFSFGFGG